MKIKELLEIGSKANPMKRKVQESVDGKSDHDDFIAPTMIARYMKKSRLECSDNTISSTDEDSELECEILRPPNEVIVIDDD